MTFVAVDKDGNEVISNYLLERDTDFWVEEYSGLNRDLVNLPKGSILKLTGKELTWEDESIEL